MVLVDRKSGIPLKSDADRKAFSAYMEGDNAIAISPEQQAQFLAMARTFEPQFRGMGYYGSWSTGVISHADEIANMEGYKFYQNVYNSLLPDAVTPMSSVYKFKTTDYNTKAFSEVNTPNTYVNGISGTPPKPVPPWWQSFSLDLGGSITSPIPAGDMVN